MRVFGRRIASWRAFERVRAKGCSLLIQLDAFPDAVLVSGCQRSGTTAVAALINESPQMVRYQVSKDSELDGALLLCGYRAPPRAGRYCFQTTYLNNCFEEYFEHTGYRLIWLLREPYAVIYSMLHNWRRGALNRLFHACGTDHLSHAAQSRYRRYGALAVPRLERAVASYRAKVSQLFRLAPLSQRLMAVDYDELIGEGGNWVPRLCAFAGIEWQERFESLLVPRSFDRTALFSRRDRERIARDCMDLYRSARAFAERMQTGKLPSMPEQYSDPCGVGAGGAGSPT